MNYTKPNWTDGAYWLISGGIGVDHAPANYSVPKDCWDYNESKLVFRAITNKDYIGWSYWYCYNGSSWNVVKSYNGGRGFWEEAIYWIDSNISNNTVTSFEPVNLVAGSYNWNVQCYDTAFQGDLDLNRALTIAVGGSHGGGGAGPPPPQLPPPPLTTIGNSAAITALLF